MSFKDDWQAFVDPENFDEQLRAWKNVKPRLLKHEVRKITEAWVYALESGNPAKFEEICREISMKLGFEKHF